ncbi:MAG: hypothetical protein AAB360_00075 [Patescibacteria group bacterium]
MKSRYDFVVKAIKGNGRYLLVIAILLSTVVFYDRPKVNIASSKQLFGDGNLVLDSAKNDYKFINVIGSGAGETYRLVFDLKVRPNGMLYPEDFFERVSYAEIFSPEELDDSPLEILTDSKFNGQQKIGEIVGKNQPFYSRHELYFQTDDNYQNIMIRRAENYDDNRVFLRNFHLVKLETSSLEEAEKLKPYLENNLYNYELIAPVEPKNLASLYRFWRSRRVAGQTFKVSDGILTGISLKLSYRGQSEDNYVLQLNEAEYVDGRFIMKPKVLTQYFFNLKSLKYYEEENGSGVYRLPLSYNLERDKYYFIGIDAANAKVTPWSYLSIHGSRRGGDYADGQGAKRLADGSGEELGDFYFKLHLLRRQSGDPELLNGARVEDFGQGEGRYFYQTQGNYADFLSIIPEDRDSNDVFYTFNRQNGIVGVKKGKSYRIRVNTLYPAKRLRVEADGSQSKEEKVRLFYSLDNKDWRVLAHRLDDEGEEIPGKFEEQIKINGQASVVFLKAECYPESKAGSCGLTSLRLEGDLIMR